MVILIFFLISELIRINLQNLATEKGVSTILTPTVRIWFATGWRDEEESGVWVQEGSRLQLRRLGVAGREHEAVTVEDGNPKGPEAIPDFQIEGDREPAGRQQSPCSFPQPNSEELVRFSLFAYIRVLSAYQHEPFLFFRPWFRFVSR